MNVPDIESVFPVNGHRPLRQCMGGWCQQRESCAHYWAPQRPWHEPAENLCRELAQVAEPVEVMQ